MVNLFEYYEIITNQIYLFFSLINFYDWEFILTTLMIIICPVTWNLVARFEFHTKYLSNLVGDNRLAADIFAHILIEMGIFRNYFYSRTIRHQSHMIEDPDTQLLLFVIGWIIAGIGFIFVASSSYRLGIHGIYYSDYFGLLLKERITAFPYNILEDPMYVGSVLIFFGMAMRYSSPSGILMTFIAWIMYKFASYLENPMTELIYSDKNKKEIEELQKERKRNAKKRKGIKSN